jgi:hypothetical protein
VCFDLVWFGFRKILLYPRGDELDDHFTMYLVAVKTPNMSEGWSRDVKLNLLVFNQLNTNNTIKRGVFSSSFIDLKYIF